jgi:hypothetical protein
MEERKLSDGLNVHALEAFACKDWLAAYAHLSFFRWAPPQIDVAPLGSASLIIKKTTALLGLQVLFAHSRTMPVELASELINKLIVDPPATVVHLSVYSKVALYSLASLNDAHVHQLSLSESCLCLSTSAKESAIADIFPYHDYTLWVGNSWLLERLLCMLLLCVILRNSISLIGWQGLTAARPTSTIWAGWASAS